MIIEIEPHSGFCSGVKRVVKLAETELNEGKKLQCLGEIVHNQAEVERLERSGMDIVSSGEVPILFNSDVLIRAHGEPPSTYEKLSEGNNRVIDGTCPVVLRVQHKIKEAYKTARQEQGKIIIYGKPTHPEVIGLLGQVNNDALAVSHVADLVGIDFSKPIYLFSQTTMPLDGYQEFSNYIRVKMRSYYPDGNEPLHLFDTICRQVANRIPQLKEFAQKHELIIFVGGAKSSNGKVLFATCQRENNRSYFVSELSDIQSEWFSNVKSVGICGATSTPVWQMEDVRNKIIQLVETKK